MEKRRMTVMEVLIVRQSIKEITTKLVDLQNLPDSGGKLEDLGLGFVDVNRTINLLDDYDKVLSEALNTAEVEWPPKV